MKKVISLVVLVVITAGAFGQKTRLNGYASYVFDDSFEAYGDISYYNGKIKGGFQGGAGIEYLVKPNYGLELMYLNQQSNAPTYYYDPTAIGNERSEDFKLGINYILLAPNGYAPSSNGKLEGFGGFLIGMAIVNIDNNAEDESVTKTRFAWGARLGGNIWVTPKVGIKLQAQLLSVAQGAGGGFYFGTGGAGAGVSTYSTIYQFGLGGGLTFKIGN